jgi:hypothetical protein
MCISLVIIWRMLLRSRVLKVSFLVFLSKPLPFVKHASPILILAGDIVDRSAIIFECPGLISMDSEASWLLDKYAPSFHNQSATDASSSNSLGVSILSVRSSKRDSGLAYPHQKLATG